MASRPLCTAGAVGTLVRYSMVWPIFVAREVLAAYDDALSFWMNAILGDEWDEGGPDEARHS
ncbi:MAG TPA: hypothetical protein VFI54_04120 [Solirubrobacteraceae bacterium]|nr:hypothetical protein [Solirubrobacteraceae bacterium]